MGKDLRKRTVHAVLWSGLQRFSQQGIQLVIRLVLARLLGPGAFGIVAMLAVFRGMSQALIDSGFSNALIQQKEVSQKDISTAFYTNLLIGIVMAGVFYLTAPWIAEFYAQPELIPLARFFSLTFIINALGFSQEALLRKNMNFKALAAVNVPPTLISGLVGIGLALMGFGVWALAWQIFAASLTRTLLLWIVGGWRPRLLYSWLSLRTMFSFGSKMMFSGLLNTIFMNLYVVVIGKLFSETDLGLYSNAQRLQFVLSASLCGIITSVMFPAFATIQDNLPRMKKALSTTLKTLMIGNGLMMVGLAVVADNLFRVLLGEEWMPSVPYFRVLCYVGLLLPFHALNLQVLMSMGRSGTILVLEITKKTLTLLAIVITYRWGIMAMIYGQCVTSTLSLFINAYCSGRFLNYGPFRQIADVSPYLLLSFVTGGVMLAIGEFLPLENTMVVLALQLAGGLAVWGLLNLALKLEVFMLLWNPIRKRLFSRTPHD